MAGCIVCPKMLNGLPRRQVRGLYHSRRLPQEVVETSESQANWGVVELQVTIERGTEVLIEPVPPSLVSQITGRNRSLFHADMGKNRCALTQACSSARVLVIGAAGSIGSAVVKLLALLEPAALVLVDMNENSLADLVRALRAGPYRLSQDFVTSVAMFGTPGFERFLQVAGPFQVMFNFAALKHVRSERDPFSLMRMIETNVFAVEDLARSVASRGARLFSVSSDKAVFPSSLMGATKRWMERVLAEPSNAACASARFANVAFSNGSLLHAILERLEQRQPVAAPDNIRRYFISHTEAAELCLLAGFLGRSAEIFVPRLDPARDSVLLDEAARRVLAFRELEAAPCASEAEAKSSPLLAQTAPRGWPCFFSPSDTSGEKGHEELLYADEAIDASRFDAINVVRSDPSPRGRLAEARKAIEVIASQDSWPKAGIVDAIRHAVPELRHLELKRSLDNKL
jgi:FlaA1/EpsC-like NDP-sugar epimerase